MFDFIFENLGKNKTIIFITTLVVLDVLIYLTVFGVVCSKNTSFYFLDVGQGDSELIKIAGNNFGNSCTGGVDILIDGGPPNNKVAYELSEVMPFMDRYIDLVILTHPQLDHYGGLIDVLERYKVGVFIHPGLKSSSPAVKELENIINYNNITAISLERGDVIKMGGVFMKIIHPPEKNRHKDINDDSLVSLFEYGGTRALFTGDIRADVEKVLTFEIKEEIDILKVPHHGSRFSSSRYLLRKLKPAVSVIEVGNNSYGHPTQEVLKRLSSVGSKIFRTDTDGTVKLEIAEKGIRVFTESNH